jgi:predicted protein tyrosine phosphatase
MSLNWVRERVGFSDKRAVEEEGRVLAEGVTHVITLAGKPKRINGVEYSEFRFPDDPGFDVREVVRQVYQYLKPIYGKPKVKVLVHCMGGMSRSPSVVIGLLILFEGMSYQ